MTHQQWPVRRIFGALAAPFLMAGLLIAFPLLLTEHAI